MRRLCLCWCRRGEITRAPALEKILIQMCVCARILLSGDECAFSDDVWARERERERHLLLRVCSSFRMWVLWYTQARAFTLRIFRGVRGVSTCYICTYMAGVYVIVANKCCKWESERNRFAHRDARSVYNIFYIYICTHIYVTYVLCSRFGTGIAAPNSPFRLITHVQLYSIFARSLLGGGKRGQEKTVLSTGRHRSTVTA